MSTTNQSFLDKNISKFAASVYKLTMLIPKGKVSTYGRLATLLGAPGAARAVGQALHCNPFAPTVPCHRVIRGDGNTGGFAGGEKAKRKLLIDEGVYIDGNHIDLALFGANLK